jgi:hypothetical protein
LRFGAIRFFSLLASIMAFSRVSPAADADAGAYHRLAVIGSPALAKSGLTDLISAELQEGGVELVEREQLNALIQEQTLDATLGADGLDKRIEFGRLAKADALVLLREEGAGKERRVHLIVAECAQGARLNSAFYPAGGSVAEMAHSIAFQVAETRKQFSGGIKAMIGVPPFIAKSFTYEYHPLQAGYAALLCEALTALPGAAVIEVEEARAIRKELDTSGGKVHGVVPLFVEGEFEVVAKAGVPASVGFKITVDAAKQSRTIDREGLTLAEATQFVSRELPRAIVPAGGAGLGQPFIPEKEFAKLTERADAFAKVAEWAHSIELRNAALVIQPDDADQRMKVVDECIALIDSSGAHDDARAGQTRTAGTPGFITSIFEMALQNLEWLFRTKGPDVLHAPDSMTRLLMHPTLDVGSVEDVALRRLVHDFLLNIYPVITFDANKGSPPTEAARAYRYAWSERALWFAIHCSRGSNGEPDYELILAYLNNIIPEGQQSSANVMKLLTDLMLSARIPAWALGAARVPYTRFADFVQRLGEAKRPEIRILARFQNLYKRVMWDHFASDAASQEIEDLRQAWNDLKIDPLPASPHFIHGRGRSGESSVLLVELDRLQDQIVSIRKMQAATQPAPPGIASTADVSQKLIHFEKIPLRYERANGAVVEPSGYERLYRSGLHVVRCTDSVDAYWCPYAIAFMREPGVLVEAADIANNRKILDVKWDGGCLWIATEANELVKMDASARVMMRLGAAQDLPPFDGGAILTVLAPDQLAIVGCFGPAHRAFIATVAGDKGSYKVNIIHKAVRVPQPGTFPINGAAAADQAFVPLTSNLCRSKGGGRFLIVCRSGDPHPLIINLASSAVTVSPVEIPWPPLGYDGGLIACDVNEKICRFLRPTDAGDTLVNDLPPVRFNLDADQSIGPGDQLYGQWRGWYQLDPHTMIVTPLSHEFGSTGGAMTASAHYGFITRGFPLQRVTVDTDKIKAIPDSDRLRPPPPAAQQRPDRQWVEIAHFDADPLLVGKPFTGHLTLRFPAEPSAGGFIVRADYTIYRGDVLLGGFHENRGFQAGYHFFEMADQWRVHRTDAKTPMENVQVVPAPGEYRIVVKLVSDIDGFVYGSKTINATAR